MELITEARRSKHTNRNQFGNSFSPANYLVEQITVISQISICCIKCHKKSILQNIEDMCQTCYAYLLPNWTELKSNLLNFQLEILSQKETIHLDHSVVYKIKIDRFWGILFCGVYYEENEFSSSPHDDYWCLAFLFGSELECEQEYQSLDILNKRLSS